MTLEEIKEQVATGDNFHNWESLFESCAMFDYGRLESSIDEVAERYAQSQTQELIELLKAVSLSPAFEKAKEQFGTSSPNHWTNKVESVILKYQNP